MLNVRSLGVHSRIGSWWSKPKFNKYRFHCYTTWSLHKSKSRSKTGAITWWHINYKSPKITGKSAFHSHEKSSEFLFQVCENEPENNTNRRILYQGNVLWMRTGISHHITRHTKWDHVIISLGEFNFKTDLVYLSNLELNAKMTMSRLYLLTSLPLGYNLNKYLKGLQFRRFL